MIYHFINWTEDIFNYFQVVQLQSRKSKFFLSIKIGKCYMNDDCIRRITDRS